MSRDTDTPLVIQVANAIEEIIRARGIGQDELIPSERQLVGKLGVSRTTIRSAIALLIDQHKLYRVPGSGTYVRGLNVKAGAENGAGGQDSAPLIALSMIELSNPWFVELAHSLQRALDKEEYDTLFHIADYSVEAEQRFLERLCRYRHVRGLLIVPARETGQSFHIYEQLREAGIPFVFVSHQIEQVNADYVIVDGYASTYEAVSYLVQLGHARIGYICCQTPAPSATGQTRKRGYCQAMQDHHLTPLPTSSFIDVTQSVHSGYRAMGELLAHHPDVTAIVAFNSAMAVGALRKAQEVGLHVPTDLSIIGIDNVESAAAADVPLTSIAPSPEVLANIAVNVLMHRIQSPNDVRYQKIALHPNLVLRASCAPPTR